MKTEPSENAFPCHQGQDFSVREWGLTKRELFAAMAMQGLMSNIDPENYRDYIAEQSVRVADTLIKELNKNKDGLQTSTENS